MAPRALAASLAVVCFAVGAAHAEDDRIPGHTVERPVDGGIQASAFAVGLAAKLIPLRSHSLWNTELVAADAAVHDNFSQRADKLSDALLGLSLVAPALYLTGSTIDDADGDRLLLYGQAIAINTAIASITKQLVQRPRPYMYSREARVQAFAKERGGDNYLSFYSGHAAMTFCAATTGAYLLGASGEHAAATSVAWGAGFGIAAMTATLRVRAGMHFYSDVLLGSAVGMTVGYLVPALHADGKPYVPTGGQVALAGASILGGMLVGRLVPLEKALPGDEPGGISNLSLAPTAVEHGMGFAIAGGW